MRVDWESFKKKSAPRPKSEFPIGTRVYFAHQGGGKTLSMVDYAFRLRKKWKKCKIYSNVVMQDIKYTHYGDNNGLLEALKAQNDTDGVLIIIDEAHLFWGKKNGIPLEVMSAISQQRKDRKRIVFTTQVWVSLDIDLRRQVKEVVQCKSVKIPLTKIKVQHNTIYDGETVQLTSDYGFEMDKIGSEWFKHNVEYYGRYDTHQKITTGTLDVAYAANKATKEANKRRVIKV